MAPSIARYRHASGVPIIPIIGRLEGVIHKLIPGVIHSPVDRLIPKLNRGKNSSKWGPRGPASCRPRCISKIRNPSHLDFFVHIKNQESLSSCAFRLLCKRFDSPRMARYSPVFPPRSAVFLLGNCPELPRTGQNGGSERVRTGKKHP